MPILQAVTYTTDHCDGDLIPPSFWPPHPGKDARTRCAEEIISEIKDDLASIGIGTLTEMYIEVRKNDRWQPKKIFKGPKDRKLATIQAGIENGSIDCVRVEYPDRVNAAGVMVDSYANVYCVHSFSLGEFLCECL